MFGMGTGGSLRLLSPEMWGCQATRSAPLCSPLGSLHFASLSSHPQNRTGPSDSFRLTMASILTLRHSRSAFRSRFQPRFFQIIFLWSQVSFSGLFRALTLLILIPYSLIPSLQDQALDRLVSPSSIHYCTSTDDLSTLSSSRGLTRLLRWQFSSLGGLHA